MSRSALAAVLTACSFGGCRCSTGHILATPKLAMEGPSTWTIAGRPYEVRSWFIENKEQNGSRALFFLAEWNCPPCDPEHVTDGKARMLVTPLFEDICRSGGWRRFSLQAGGSPILANNIAVQIVDRSAGTPIYPHYGVLKTTSEACAGADAGFHLH